MSHEEEHESLRAPEPPSFGSLDPQPGARHELTPEEWDQVVALARGFLDHSALQPADRDDVVQESLLAFDRLLRGRGVLCIPAQLRVTVRLQERKRKQARRIGSLPEDDDAVQPGDPLDAEALLAAALAEMPEDYRAWCLQFITTGPEPGIVAGTVRWRSWCLRCWVREFFS